MPKMIEDTFIVDIEKKELRLKKDNIKKSFTIKELYSYLMDIFDEPNYMKYDLPIEAISEGNFRLINGWVIDSKAKKYIDGKFE